MSLKKKYAFVKNITIVLSTYIEKKLEICHRRKAIDCRCFLSSQGKCRLSLTSYDVINEFEGV